MSMGLGYSNVFSNLINIPVPPETEQVTKLYAREGGAVYCKII